MNEKPKRKPNRLPQYDYSTPGCYFVTFCTKERDPVLGTVSEPDPITGAKVILSHFGQLTEEAILAIPKVYTGVTLDHFVIMPNHVHLLISLSGSDFGSPDISRIVQQTKRRISKEAGQAIWQAHFHDHIIRNEADFLSIWEYIDDNPAKWSLDRYYNAEPGNHRP